MGPTVQNKYRQTDISFYFKVKNKSTMKYCLNKENTSRKLPFSEGQAGLSDTAANTAVPLEKRQSVLQELPFTLPVYEDSDEDCDSDDPALCRRNCTPQVKNNSKNIKVEANLEPAASTSALTVRHNSEAVIIISSDDEDFEPKRRKAKVTEESYSKTILTEEETMMRVQKFLEHDKTEKVKRKMYQSKTATKIGKRKKQGADISKKPQQDEILPVSVSSSSELKLSLQESPRIVIGVHPPTKEKSALKIVELSSTKTEPICPQSNLTPKKNKEDVPDINVMVTPIKQEPDVVISCSSNRTFLEQCNLSPVRAASTPVASLKSPSKKRPKYSPKSGKKLNVTPRQSKSVIENGRSDDEEWTPLALRLIKRIKQYVYSHNHLSTMLTTQEKEMLEKLKQFPKDEYLLFCIKLFTRIQRWYNIFKLSATVKLNMSDPEVGDMYNYLSENGFVETDYLKEPSAYLLHHLLRADIKKICDGFKLKLTCTNKPEMIEKLMSNCGSQTTLTSFKSTEQILKERIKDKMGFCVKLSSGLYSLLNKLHILYSFTASELQTTQELYFFMVRIETMEILMPRFQVDADFPFFSSIADFTSFADAYQCKRAVVEAIEKRELNRLHELCTLAHSQLRTILQRFVPATRNIWDMHDSEQEVRPSYLMHYTAGSKYTRALSIGSKHLAKHHPGPVEEWLQFLLNQTRFCQKMRGMWFDLLTMVQYYHLKKHKNATETLIKALGTSNLSEVARYDLSYRAESMKRSKMHKITKLQYDSICFVQPNPLDELPYIEINARTIDNSEVNRRRYYFENTISGRSIFGVEQVALNHYLAHGYTDGMHCEGSLLTTIFFVLFWDVIYETYVPGVFINEIQYYPLDLKSTEFYVNRRAALDRRLEEIKSDWSPSQLEAFVDKMWEEHAHEKSLIINSLVPDSQTLHQIILCIGRVALARILERIVKDFKAYHSGLPDLFLWNFNERKCKFAEVKSATDKLSTKQKLWLDFLRSVGADAEVCHVVHTKGSKIRTKTKKKVNLKKKEEEES